MRRPPLEPAALAFNDDGIPWSARHGDIYHPRTGAFAQARQVFLAGNGLPGRWQGRQRFVILETGFGLGNNFLATWRLWRDDARRGERLVFISIEAHPLTQSDLATVHADSAEPLLAGALLAAWPALTPDLHQLDFDDGRVQLLLAFGDVQRWLPKLVASVDAFYLDGFAPALNPRMWDERVCKALSRLAAPDATLATWSAAQAVRRHLTTAGFEVRLATGIGGKRDITLARFAPVFTPRHSASRASASTAASMSALVSTRSDASNEPQVLIVGAGLAGCAAAWALAEQGWRSTLVERHAGIAQEASGNAAALFHGIVNAQDGLHARFNRAAALMASEVVRFSLRQHGVAGAVDGLLRLETASTPAEMTAVLTALGLPPNYVQAVDARQASALVGIALQHPAWHYPGAGWVDPAGLARAYLERAEGRVTLRTGVAVQALQRGGGSGQNFWQLLDARGATIAEAPIVVLANAGDALRLLGAPDWPIERVRGQLSVWPKPAAADRTFALPRIPVAGTGYLLPAIDGAVVFGATATRADDEPAVRCADHVANLARLERLIGHPLGIDPSDLQGRVAWRWSSRDRLPVIGAVPWLDMAASDHGRMDQARFVPRIPGLFVFTALGSRGITWSALGARTLAAWMAGSPMPIEAALIDAVDPARFVSREVRRRQAD